MPAPSTRKEIAEKRPLPESPDGTSASAEAPEAQSKVDVLFPGAVFPPPDPGPPFERSKKAGDGVFRFMFAPSADDDLSKRTEGEVAPEFGESWVRRLVLHPHEASRFQKLTVAAFDLRLLALAHAPGAQDVIDVGRTDLEGRAGIVPEELRGSLVAVLNGGFQPRHGRWGMLTLGKQLIPPRDDACTVAVLDDGTLKIGAWPSLKDDTAVQAYRQTPPCLVAGGAVHEKLMRGDRKAWAGQNQDRKTRRRSAIGVSKDGRTLFYGLGTETEAEVLAAGMLHAGAHFAAQLDINWNWTRLFFFQETEGEVRPVGALEEGMAKDKGEYVYRPGKRGFFYLVRRAQH